MVQNMYDVKFRGGIYINGTNSSMKVTSQLRRLRSCELATMLILVGPIICIWPSTIKCVSPPSC